MALVHSTVNTGFAGGVNLGLAFLAPMPEIREGMPGNRSLTSARLKPTASASTASA